MRSRIFKIIPLENMIALYPYGSRVYGTATDKSDYDYIMVVDRIGDKKDELHYVWDGIEINLNVFPKNLWQSELERHYISSLECIFLPNEVKLWESDGYEFKLDLEKLRHSLAERASISFVKAKKKMDRKSPDYAPLIAKKSLFHAIRILTYGLQIATLGKIENYAAVNHYWDIIKNGPDDDWDWYKKKFQPIYNELKSEFKKVAPLE